MSTVDGSRWTLPSGKQGDILLRVEMAFPSFARFSPHIFQGLKTSADKVYLVKVVSQNRDVVSIENGLNEKALIEKDVLKPVGEDVQRYHTNKAQNLFIIYPYTVDKDGKAKIMPSTQLEKDYPKA